MRLTTLSQESVNSAHGEGLELIVVWLIVLEIVLGVVRASLCVASSSEACVLTVFSPARPSAHQITVRAFLPSVPFPNRR